MSSPGAVQSHSCSSPDQVSGVQPPVMVKLRALYSIGYTCTCRTFLPTMLIAWAFHFIQYHCMCMIVLFLQCQKVGNEASSTNFPLTFV